MCIALSYKPSHLLEGILWNSCDQLADKLMRHSVGIFTILWFIYMSYMSNIACATQVLYKRVFWLVIRSGLLTKWKVIPVHLFYRATWLKEGWLCQEKNHSIVRHIFLLLLGLRGSHGTPSFVPRQNIWIDFTYIKMITGPTGPAQSTGPPFNK